MTPEYRRVSGSGVVQPGSIEMFELRRTITALTKRVQALEERQAAFETLNTANKEQNDGFDS